MATDYLYENAPLVEVIAELHWKLVPLRAFHSEIDPFFETIKNNLARSFSDSGYPHHETLVPDDVPLEVTPRRVRERFRVNEGKWPLFQVGPGVFTVNITPPYNGWGDFRHTLLHGLHTLHNAVPQPSQNLLFTKLELRYLDAFTSAYGLGEDTRHFMREHLGLYTHVNPAALDQLGVNSSEIDDSIDVTFRVSTPENSTANIRAKLGSRSGERAIIAEFISRKHPNAEHATPESLINWFDSSHNLVRFLFEKHTSEDLKQKMGPAKEFDDGNS